MEMILKGILIGLVIVLPGVSGGTVFLVLGLYEKVIKDIAKLKLLPYIPLGLGIVIGVLLGGRLVAYIFESYRDLSAAFLLGCLLASIKPILRGQKTKNVGILFLLVLGFLIGFFFAGDSIELSGAAKDVSILYLIIGGALASATMIIPGLPGSGVLIILGIYESLLLYLNNLEIIKLSIFAISGLLGIFLLSKLLAKLYEKHKKPIAYTFVGLILGSSRVLIPYNINIAVVLIFLLGFGLVWVYGTKKEAI